MFKSKEINESQFLNNSALPRLSETYNGVPKITSTPLNSHVPPSRRNKVLLSPTMTKQGTPKRYSLSEASPSTSKTHPRVNAPHSPGPLLASLSFKDNVSMYEETKSSGLARRIVLYNEEADQERRPTHQEKYSSPGLFPIVHLFKKNPPVLEQSPKRVKIKLASPEYLRNCSPQHRSRELEEITKSSRFHRQYSLPSYSQHNDTGTKSVLDALKEISRKRIHSNEEYDQIEESGKRIRTDTQNGFVATSKRTRADSPPFDSSGSPPTKQTQKKFCVYDEFAASKSSSDFSFLAKPEPTRSKRKTTSTSTESLTDTKHVKLVNAETQTLTTVTESKTDSIVSDKTDNEKTKNKECHLKVFDDKPLENMRKSRLAALMGNLAGKDAAIQAKSFAQPQLHFEPKEPEKTPDVFKKQIAEEISSDPLINMEGKPKEIENNLQTTNLISILSPSRSTKESSPIKSDRHVHFNVTTISNSVFSQPPLTQTSASIVTPIVSDSVSQSPISDTNRKSTEIVFPVTSSKESNTKTSTASSVTPSFSFGSPASSKNETNLETKPLNTIISSSIGPSLHFSKPLDTSGPGTHLPNAPNKSESPKKMGGFKFDLKSPSSSLTPVTKPNTSTLSFPSSAVMASTVATTLLTTTSSTAFSFSKPSENKKDNTFSFGASNTDGAKNATSEPAFGFGGLSRSPSFNFGAAMTTTATESKSTGGFSFETTANGTAFGTLATSSQTPTPPNFGSLTTAANVGSSSPFSVTTSSGFGAVNSTFGAPSNSTNSAFGNEQNLSKPPPSFSFGGSTAVTNSSVAFGAKPNSVFGANTTVSTTPAFALSAGLNVASPSFGNNPSTNLSFCTAPTTTTPVFGNSTVPTFGAVQVTKPSVFGTTSATTTTSMVGNASSGFGLTNSSNVPSFKPTTTTTPGFASSNAAFGANATTSATVFGAADAKTSAFSSSNAFSTTAPVPTFGSTIPVPSFGNNANNAFGTASQPSSLFGSSATTTANPPPYGSTAFSVSAATVVSTISTFGSGTATPTFSFGSNKPTANAFGSGQTTNAGTFGASSSFSSASGFNTASSGFGSSAPPAYGSATSTPSTFGVTSAPAFGQAESKPSFAFGATDTKNSSTFGSGTGNSAFGKPTNTQTGFSNSTNTFGSTNTSSGFNTQQGNGGFNFRSNASPAPAQFGFGGANGNNDQSKPSFNFTGGANNPPTFGGNATPSFGAATPNFGAAPPSFAATGSPATGVFNIGAGSATTGRPRTQLRAKRRT